jgi:hypothetical protein
MTWYVGRFVCEKKYILSKGWKRTRKYNLQPNTQPKGVDLSEESDLRVPRLRQPSTSFLAKYLDSPKSSIPSNNAQNKRKKLSRQKYIGDKIIDNKASPLIENFRTDEDISSMHDDFRSAFVDDETGEVYEGGSAHIEQISEHHINPFLFICRWFSGFRHGYGICLHIDGTMYEGNWVYGKQSGKGQLMTSDRQVNCF